jgi:hypothetical protein
MKKRRSANQLSGGCLSLFGLPFLAAGIFMSWLYFSGFAKWWSARGWDEVPCRIVGAGLKANHDSDGTTYRATADYRYSYEGRMYQGDQVSFHNGADNVGDFQQRAHRELSGYLADADADENARMFRCFVNPKDATESVLYRTLRWEMQAFLAIFALTFPAIGAGLVLGGMMSGAAARKTAALRIRHPDEPWKWQPQWSAKPIRESSGPWRTGLYFYTLWSGIIVAALVGAATLGGAFENGGAAWLLLVFVALWCVPGWFSLRQFRHRMAVGEAGFHAKEIPTCPGGVMEGAILLQRPPPMRRPVEVDLVCEKSITRKSGDGDSTTTEKVWSHRETVPTDAIVRDLSGFRVPVRIAVPADAPESGNGEDSSIRHTWKLRLKVPGTAIDSAFEVPVFRTAGPPTLPVSPASGAPSILDEAAADFHSAHDPPRRPPERPTPPDFLHPERGPACHRFGACFLRRHARDLLGDDRGGRAALDARPAVEGGWLTAEYSMLPYSTLDRKPRDISRGKLDGRSSEIQRLIGRALRAVVDLKKDRPAHDVDRLRRAASRRRHPHRLHHRRLRGHGHRAQQALRRGQTEGFPDPETRRGGVGRGLSGRAGAGSELSRRQGRDGGFQRGDDRDAGIRGSSGQRRGSGVLLAMK